MAEQLELEQRIHRLREAYDDVVPKTPGLELRVMARIATPSPYQPPKPSLGRDLALAGAFIIFVAVLAVGLTNLRALRQPAQPTASASPTPTASISATPVAQVPADDLARASLPQHELHRDAKLAPHGGPPGGARASGRRRPSRPR